MFTPKTKSTEETFTKMFEDRIEEIVIGTINLTLRKKIIENQKCINEIKNAVENIIKKYI